MRLRYVFALVVCAVWVFAAFAFNVQTAHLQSNALSENFEAGGKTAYAAANVSLSSGSWYFDDALDGNTSGDVKTGSYSVRAHNTGSISMNFNVPSAGTVTIQHAEYGSDGSSTWELDKSTNNGSSWTKVGSTVTTGSTSLQTVSFTVNSSSAVRFRFLKLSGGANRINFDNLSITSYSVSTPTPTPTATPKPTATPTPAPTATPTPAPTATPVQTTNVNLTMGNPSGATTSVSNPSNYLLVKNQFVESYNRDNGKPNWVSWHVESADLGSAARQNDFRGDTTLPAGWYQVQTGDYTGSGFDRGHNCPSADRTATTTDNSATFLMTNMMPQAPDNNQGPWAVLENYTRDLVNQGNEVYVIAGSTGNSGTIASGHVVVPTSTWKVIMVLPQGSSDVSRVNSQTRLIAIWMPNQQGIRNDDWKQYRVSVDYVEQMTGYDFFSNVSPSVQSQIESTVDNK